MKFLAFWKLRSKSWGTNTLLVPQPKSWGTSLPRSPRFLRLWIWSPCTARDIDAVERVQRRFSKCLRGYIRYSYPERLHRLQLQSLKLKRLITDLLWCYKIVSNVNDIHMDKFFVFSTCTYTREHPYKLCRNVDRVCGWWLVWDQCKDEMDLCGKQCKIQMGLLNR